MIRLPNLRSKLVMASLMKRLFQNCTQAAFKSRSLPVSLSLSFNFDDGDYPSQSQGYFDPIKMNVPNVWDLLDELHVGKYSPTRIKYFSRSNVMKMWISSYLTVLEARPLLAFVVICLVIISEWPPLSHRLLWFW